MTKFIQFLSELPKEFSFSFLIGCLVIIAKYFLAYLNRRHALIIQEKKHIMDHKYRMQALATRAIRVSQRKDTVNDN